MNQSKEPNSPQFMGYFNPRREPEGYLLVLLSALSFLLFSAYLMNNSAATSQSLKLSYMKEQVGVELKPQNALVQLREKKFIEIPGERGELDLGYLREGVWVLMEFNNPAGSKTSSFVLQLRHTYINGSVTELTGSDASRGYQTAGLGETIPFTDKLLPRSQQLNDVRHVSFPIKVAPGETYRALVRLKAHVMNVPFLLLDERIFLSSVIRELVPIASLFGGLILLALYNGMVGLARKESEFLFYGVYVASIALMAASINGTGHMFLWPDMLWLHYNSANILINLVSLSYMAFSYAIFKKTPLVGVERALWIFFSSLCVIGFALQVFEGGFFASIQTNIAALAALSLGIFRAWRARQQYGRIANLFILSEGVLFAGAVAYCIKMFGWLPSTSFTLNIVLVSATLEAILLSFVLSEKMRRTMEEKEAALSQLEKAHVHLEASVRDRTLALAARYTSHEVLNPVFAIRLKAERIRDEVLLENQSQAASLSRASEQVILKVNEIFQLIDSIIQTIRAIKSMSTDGQREKVVSVDLQAALDDALKMLEVKMLQVKCNVESDFSHARWVLARRSDVVQVLTNLISNSLDAVVGQEKPWVRVSSRGASLGIEKSALQRVDVSVCDSGAGPSEEIRGQLFDSPVTTKDVDAGMGLGLSFCQRLVDRNGGSIEFDENSSVTRFCFSLPLADADEENIYQEFRKAG